MTGWHPQHDHHHPARNLPSARQGLPNHCASMPAPDPVDSDPLWAYSLPPQATDGLIQQDIDPPAELKPFSGTCVFPATSNQQVGGDSDFPVPHGKTGYVPCALAGNNAQCPFTVVIRQNICPRTLTSPASHSLGLVIGDLIPLLVPKFGYPMSCTPQDSCPVAPLRQGQQCGARCQLYL